MYYLQPTKMEILLVTDDYYYYCIIPWILGKCFAITRTTCSFQQLWVDGELDGSLTFCKETESCVQWY